MSLPYNWYGSALGVCGVWGALVWGGVLVVGLQLWCMTAWCFLPIGTIRLMGLDPAYGKRVGYKHCGNMSLVNQVVADEGTQAYKVVAC